jgi:hypothetical protein
MTISTSKSQAIAFIVLPLILWLAMYLAARWWSINWRPILPWLRILRWLGWGFGGVLVLASMVRNVFPITDGVLILTFSAGLSMPESWVKRRFAPN